MNLICPARILLPVELTVDSAERIAQVYAVPSATSAGEQLAERLGVPLTVLPEVDLQAIADLHRGETVVLLGTDLGLPLPAVIEHTGDGWTAV